MLYRFELENQKQFEGHSQKLWGNLAFNLQCLGFTAQYFLTQSVLSKRDLENNLGATANSLGIL